MKVTKVINVPAQTRTVLDKMVCDLCGLETPYDTFDPSNYSAIETEVRLKTGTAYPESGSGNEIEFHICPDCFKNKLIPWMKSQGAKPTEREWYY